MDLYAKIFFWMLYGVMSVEYQRGQELGSELSNSRSSNLHRMEIYKNRME